MDWVLTLSEVDLGLTHSLEYLFWDMMEGEHPIHHIPSINNLKNGNPRSISLEVSTQSIISLV
jgi:hypothetical protein